MVESFSANGFHLRKKPLGEMERSVLRSISPRYIPNHDTRSVDEYAISGRGLTSPGARIRRREMG